MSRTPPLVVLVLLSGFAFGCAARQPEPETAPPPAPGAGGHVSPARLSEVDALEHDLEAAERRVNAELDKKLSTVIERSDEKTDEGIGAEGSTKPKQQAPPNWRDAERGTPCDNACRALSSMKRSTERICELAGADDSRCAAAKARLARAEERVRQAGCACRER